MGNIDSILAAILFYLIILWPVMLILGYLFYLDIKRARNIQSKELLDHQNWLFNQLYSMAPGKVLMPDEVEEITENKPAKVYSPYRDPDNQFKGHNDDWHAS